MIGNFQAEMVGERRGSQTGQYSSDRKMTSRTRATWLLARETKRPCDWGGGGFVGRCER
jgi:hypothetical protein